MTVSAAPTTEVMAEHDPPALERPLQFVKMHALGNNYIYMESSVDHPNFDILESFSDADFTALATHVSDEKRGIGSDGLIVIDVVADPVAAGYDASISIFNRDGSAAMNCGNGVRCSALYLHRYRGMKDRPLHIRLPCNRVVSAVVFGHRQVRANLGEPCVISEDPSLYLVCVGNRHAVMFLDRPVEELTHAEITAIAQPVQKKYDANVELVSVTPSGSDLRIRVFERGSGITSACGTGACASAIAAIVSNRIADGKDVLVSLDGGPVTVRWDRPNHSVHLTGEVMIVADGKIFGQFPCK